MVANQPTSENIIKKPRKFKCDVSRWKSSKKNMKQNNVKISFVSIFLGFLFLSIIIISIIFLSKDDLKCTDSIDTDTTIRKLRFHLYGQMAAVDSIKNAFLSDQSLKIIPFVGGTGQGKTYASQLIASDLNKGSVQFLLQPSLDRANTINVISKKIRQCQYTLLILDDLRMYDIVKTTIFISKILTEIAIGTKLDIILIFNTEIVSFDFENRQTDSAFPGVIYSHLSILGIPIFMTEFKVMANKDIRMCARDALGKYYFEQTEENIDKLMEMASNIQGCKGLFSKASLMHKNEF